MATYKKRGYKPKSKKEKEEKKAGPKLNITPDVLKALQTAQKSAEAQDFAAAKTAIAEADSKAASNDDKYQIGAIKLNTGIGAKDEALEAYREALKIYPTLQVARAAESRLVREQNGQGL